MPREWREGGKLALVDLRAQSRSVSDRRRQDRAEPTRLDETGRGDASAVEEGGVLKASRLLDTDVEVSLRMPRRGLATAEACADSEESSRSCRRRKAICIARNEKCKSLGGGH